jgi:hypothetical protein
MGTCTGISAIQLLAMASTFLLAVLWLDAFWVKIPEQMHQGDVPGALRKRNWLNAFVALGAAGAAILLLMWVGTCTNGTL